MSDDPNTDEHSKRAHRYLQVQMLRINWPVMGDMANTERASAAKTIRDLLCELEVLQQAMQNAERDIFKLRTERDSARRRICWDCQTPLVSPMQIAFANDWDCFKDLP